ncbi:MAG: hypothetical protein R3234_04970 [Thermoanaerobaculia bacterium]|nr:hypothetical protein [Thermoanaerobaculia bacterium]
MIRSLIPLRLAGFLLLAAISGSVVVGCTGSRPPIPASAISESRVPLVLVPGVTGTELRTVESGEIAWGSGWRLLFPRDRGHAVVLSLLGGPPRVEAGAVLEELTLGPIRKPIYEPLNDWFQTLGYRPGDLDHPRPGDTYFSFAHDWRRSNVTSAAILRRRLEELRRARDEELLEVDLLCQSNGAHICRYLMKHGGRPLAEAESGDTARRTFRVRKLVLVGASNGGSLRIFRMLHRGRRYLPMGRLWSPETLFTFASFFQDLPAPGEDLFLDPSGRSLDVDLYDPDSWIEYQWSLFDPEVREKIEAADRPDLFGDPARRRDVLRRRLRAALRFRELLAADVELPGTELYIVQGAYAETPARAVLMPSDTGWRTLFGEDSDELPLRIRPLLVAPGDGHATHESQWDLSPSELSAVADDPHHVRAGHFEAILQPSTLMALAKWLTD